jgi:spore germination cell wall hydrolase CwlJ-like protein
MRRKFLLAPLLFVSVTASANTANGDDEVNCLALNIYHEARGEPQEGQLAVAYVTMNRVASPRYPKTVCAVVWQNGQFSWTRDGRSDVPRDQRAWDRAKRIASFIYTNYARFQEVLKGATDMTKGALFYFAPKKVSPYWTRNMVATTAIGSHVFLSDEHKSDG